MPDTAATLPPGALPIDARLKRVLRFMPAPVGIVTSFDPDDGTPVGLAMSALMPVCLDPPSMAICVNRSGSAHDTMIRAGRFCINLLHGGQDGHVAPFADPAARAERFRQSDWRQHVHSAHEGVWFIDDAPAAIFCTIKQRVSFGTHDLLVGEVDDLICSGSDEILGWADGALCRPTPLNRKPAR
ncbi:flavin reductase family protein [Novosphingobium sp. SL115]|uniref:flavin reductase family protein n=1 Tax=Novosphingobium sp. SL115 TaxID=2995150 RepID=UPI0022760009|nr:flavin reductase family protein [Novosphingobium sp. SL115]MCY1672839.1 flavin reductase family protein [Novosphingobium sp. SL115]